MCTMFCTSSASCTERSRTCSSGLYLTLVPLVSVGSNLRQMCPMRRRAPAVRCQFSPLRSWTKAECGQVRRVGTTTPTPLPLRVGAKTRTWPGPQSRR